MPKPGKSSASSATRKKHALKAAKAQGAEPPVPLPKTKKGKKADVPPVKMYIPPVKPTAPRPDPLDARGLASQLPADLVVVLRKFGKKDAITKRRGLEELQAEWVDRVSLSSGDEEEYLLGVLEVALPVWYHHYPSLVMHASRIIRSLAVSLHASLLAIPSLRTSVLYFLSDVADTAQLDQLVGAWSMSAFDLDVPVATKARKSWDDLISWTGAGDTQIPRGVVPFVSSVATFVQQAVMAPASIYLTFNPPAPEAPVVTPRARGGKQAGRSPATPISRREPDQAGTGKTDPDEEEEGDRNARYRVGAMGVLRWILERLAPMLSTISVVLLRSAWVEPDAGVRAVMREPLLLFLRNYPQAWLLEASANAAKASLDKDDEDVDSGDEAVPSATTKNLSQFSMAYREFLDYLKLGCGGSPTQGFPTVLIVLSTIPNELLSMEQDSLRVLFDSFWAAVDGRALSSLDRGAFPAFLSSLLECLLFCLRKIRSHDSAAGEAEPEEQENTLSINLVMGQFTEVWNSLGTSRLHLEARAAGDILARTLLRLEDVDKGKVDPAPTRVMLTNPWLQVLCLHAWSTIAASTMESVQHPTEEKAKDTWSFKFDCLGTIDEKLPSQPIARKEISHLLDELVKWGLAQLRQSSKGPGGLDRATIVLSTLINKFWPSISQDSKQLLDAYFLGDSGSLQLQLSSANSVGLLLGYLGANAESPDASTVWHLSLEQLQASFIATGDLSGLKVLLDHAGRGALSRFPLRANQELDVLAETILLEVEGGHGSEKATFLGQLLAQPDIFVNDSTAGQVIRRISHLISKRVSTVFKQETPLGSTARCLEVLLPLFTAKSPRCRLASPILPELLLFAYVAPLYDEGEDELEHCISSSQRICSVWKDSQPTNVADVRQALFARIHEMIQDVDVRISSAIRATDIVEAAASLEFQSALESGPSGLQSIIPPQTTFTALFDQSLIGYIDEPTALYNPSLRQPMLPHLSFDKWGFSSYARLTTALLHTFSLDHHFSPHQTWALKHLSLLERLADDYASDSEVDNAMFGPDANRGHVERIQEEAARIQTYAFATLMNDVEAGWHVSLCNRLRRGKGKSNSEDDPLVNLVEEIYFDALANEVSNVKGCRLLRRVLHALLKTGDTMVNDTDQWIAVAEAKRANTEGIALLRQLIASAPASESEASLLPQQRTVFLLQALQKWVASSEDLNEEIDGLLAHLCTHLAPIIQSVPGAHWDLIFDLMESNLEAGSLRDRETYTTLQRTLLLILKVEELVATNKSLTALWSERRGEVLRLVANHLLVPSGSLSSISLCMGPRFLKYLFLDDLPKNRRCRNLQHLLVSMAKDLSVPLSETEHFVLCDMMKEPSFALQEDVYEILCRLATQWNEQLVINAAVDTQADEEAKYELPRQLVALLQAVAPGDLDEESDSEEQARTTGYLLSWMLLFEFFDKISIKVRNSYLEQLRNLDLVSTSFVPKLLSLLKVTDGRKPFPVEPWAVDEFHLSLWDDSLPVRFQVLAVHAYYRSLIAVPPLVRAWFQECKDRNLTATLSAYTSKSFTPVLVAAEVAPLRSPESNEELADERFRVKIITAANDVSVSAAFIVDEQPMEIAVKFPSDYPLRPVGVEDVRRLNVPERKWRQWMLNILQAMQAGSVVDALSLWKRNVALHFEGITECAICYSIISVTDQTLPSKT
ncbi:hypothetical protein FRB99_009054, partial [Tulasnella sp. 403]